jgi:hypothetical protein
MNGPIKASQVETSTEKSADELRREKAKAVSAARLAKRAAMRKAAKDPTKVDANSSPDLATRLEAGLKVRDSQVHSRHARSRDQIKGAVAARLAEKEA